MTDPLDFIPGFHSLWLIDGFNNTILQSSIAAQRNLSKEIFLEHICRKADLEKYAWKKNKALQWRRSPGLWYSEPL